MSAERSGPGLVRAIGVLGLSAGIVNITIGGSIFRLPADAAAALGPAAPIAYVICAVAMSLIVLCFAEAGSRVALTGGLYAYVEVAFGPLVGFLAGWVLTAGLTVAMAAIATVYADSLGALVPALAGPAARATVIVVTLGALAAVNVLGVRVASRFNIVMTAAKLVPLAVLVIAGAFFVRPENLVVHQMPSVPQLARTSVTLMFAFLGVESALVPSGEVREPSRTVPRAIFLAMAVIAIAYVSIHVVAEGVLGPALATSATPLADAAAVPLGAGGRRLILVGAAISMLGFLSGMTLAVPRLFYAFGESGVLPRRFSALHPRFRTPVTAILTQTALAILLAVTGSFAALVVIANVAVLIVYAACAVAVMALRRRDVREAGEPYRVPGGWTVPLLASAVILVLLVEGLKPREWAAVAIALLVGLVLYGIAALRGSVRRPEAALE